MLHISSQEEFGLRFLLRLAQVFPESLSLTELAELEGVSLAYARKIFNVLRGSDLVKASRGVYGGYMLARDPESIDLAQVFAALATRENSFDCSHFSGKQSVCVNHGNCGVLPVLSLLQSKMNHLMSSINLVSLYPPSALELSPVSASEKTISISQTYEVLKR